MASSAAIVELELCPNCKKEIPQVNYVMHTMHCARNIALCPICKEPVPKGELGVHQDRHAAAKKTASQGTQLGATTTWKSKPYTGPFPEKLGHGSAAPGAAVAVTNGSDGTHSKMKKQPTNDLDACKYCDLELPRDTIKEHEEYCGTRTDKCNECGEFVMFKYKKLHEDSNHGFVKLNDEPGPKASWDSATQRPAPTPPRRPHSAYSPFDMSTLGNTFNMSDYIPPSLTAPPSTRYYDPEDTYRPSGAIGRNPDKVDYKDLSRRLDCKTEYIKNLLHDSASITAPFRTSATAPRNHFNHHKGPAPQPPQPPNRRNPPTQLTIPCEFCQTPIPHEDLIQHETGCRPDLACVNPRRRRQRADDDEEYCRQTPSPPASPEVELPCEFCSDLIPASQLLRHQATCN